MSERRRLGVRRRPLPAVTRQWMTIALVLLLLIVVGFAIWG